MSKATSKVLDVIDAHWPVSPVEIGAILKTNENSKSASNRYGYSLKRLHEAGLIELKKSGRTYIAWPKDLERLRDRKLREVLVALHDLIASIARGAPDSGKKARAE